MSEEPQTPSESAPEEAGATPVSSQDPKSRKTFSRIKIELSDDELASPGVQKMIVEELGRSQETISIMEGYREKFYRADRDLAVEREKNKKNLFLEIISGGCLAAGAAAFGYAPSLTTLPLAGWIAVAFGVVLTVIGVMAKGILLK
jgi:hypothetical protein